MPLRCDTFLPGEEQDLLADTWLQAMDLLASGDAAEGQALLRRGIQRARDMEAPWQPSLVLHWQAALNRYHAAPCSSARPPREAHVVAEPIHDPAQSAARFG